jgi:thymidylate kinase
LVFDKKEFEMSLYVSFDGGSGVGKGALIEWCREYFSAQGKRVAVLKDNRLDPLRDTGALMLSWCAKNHVDQSDFLFPLFAAGYAHSDMYLNEALCHHDIVLRDRCFISSLAYVAASGRFDSEQIWSLYVESLRIRVPNVAVLVDADLDIATSRIKRRKQKDIGLGGKMSGDRNRREAVREHFLALPARFGDRVNMIAVSNNGAHTDDSKAFRASLDMVGEKIVEFCRQKEEVS